MINFISNIEQQIDKCQDYPIMNENIRLKEDYEMLKMSPYLYGEDISSVEDYLQNIENQHAND